MSKIQSLDGQIILDSRGVPTIEATVVLEGGARGVASVPAGALTGRYEAKIQTDLTKSVNALRTSIGPAMRGRDATEQAKLDQYLIELDGTQDKSNLGANTILGTSLAIARAAAAARSVPLYRHIMDLYSPGMPIAHLPTPMFNLINGGAHADNNIPFQDFMIVPASPAGGLSEEMSFREKLEIGRHIFATLKKQLEALKLSTNVGEEGGYAPQFTSNEEAVEILSEAIARAGYEPRAQVSIAIDVAAGGIADLKAVTYPHAPIDYYDRLITEYPIETLEDPFGEDDWQDWTNITGRLGPRAFITGDDLFSTNMTRLGQGIERKAANSISVKPNQIGTLSETLQVIKLAKDANMAVQISHRAGETEDTFIAHLAVATASQFIKAGAPNRGERIAKYNELLRIEKELLGR